MTLSRPGAVGDLVIWSLLASWLFFGGLEFGEQLDFIAESSAHEQQDLDANALLQLASGLKPDVSTLTVNPTSSLTGEVAQPTGVATVSTVFHSPGVATFVSSSLRLHQRLSVYRI